MPVPGGGDDLAEIGVGGLPSEFGVVVLAAGLRGARDEKFHAFAPGEQWSEQVRSRPAAISGVISRCASPSIL